MAVETKTDAGCNDCAASCGAAQLTKLGVETGNFDYIVALAGNPNTGKSTVFNQLTGLRQHVGNWAGKTVARAEGAFEADGKKFKLVDLPGTYSLLSTSIDEEIARDFILFGQPDVTVIVADATRLERSLHLVLQILEITSRAVVALNLMDEAGRNNLKIDERELSRELGVPVVPMSARRGEGISELINAVSKTAKGEISGRVYQVRYKDRKLESAIADLSTNLRDIFGDLPNARWVAMRLLEGDESIVNAVQNKTLGAIKAEINQSQFAFAD